MQTFAGGERKSSPKCTNGDKVSRTLIA